MPHVLCSKGKRLTRKNAIRWRLRRMNGENEFVGCPSSSLFREYARSRLHKTSKIRMSTHIEMCGMCMERAKAQCYLRLYDVIVH